RLDIAIQAGANPLGRVAADRGRDEHAIAPHDRARNGNAGNRCLPHHVLSRRYIPFRRGRPAVGHAGRIGAAERRPVLRGKRRRSEHADDERQTSPHDYFSATRVKGVVLLPCVNDRPVTLPSATWNVIVTPGAPITRNFVASIDDRTNFCPGGPPVSREPATVNTSGRPPAL